MSKTLVGPQLRQLRRAHKQTQADMARALGVSAAYVNLLENNQRSLSVKVLMSLTDAYGVDWRSLVNDAEMTHLAELRAAVRNPIFAADPPDLQELRAGLDHAPKLVEQFLHLYRQHMTLRENMRHLTLGSGLAEMTVSSPEAGIYDFFRDHGNHFPSLEVASEAARDAVGGQPDELYGNMKTYLKSTYDIEVKTVEIEEMSEALRIFDQKNGRVLLSRALDYVNRNFQLAYIIALVHSPDLLDQLVAGSGISGDAGQARCRVELANYFAAAFLMPYEAVLSLADASAYDVDRIATTLGVSFEQACQRLTTLQRPGAQGVPFFFLRVDKSGNVTKRFNATPFTLAEQGGSCPVWNIQSAFAQPGTIVPQFVELPDKGRFFTVSRTTDRPVFNRHTQDRRLVVTLGCELTHVDRVGYARPFNVDDSSLTAHIGINCRICPRHACAQRAHEPLHLTLPIDTNRRGSTRYES
ncbi:MAG: short-chain fatty acyl-CoA regulator family protein [Pseudomonadota bacterium]